MSCYIELCLNLLHLTVHVKSKRANSNSVLCFIALDIRRDQVKNVYQVKLSIQVGLCLALLMHIQVLWWWYSGQQSCLLLRQSEFNPASSILNKWTRHLVSLDYIFFNYYNFFRAFYEETRKYSIIVAIPTVIKIFRWIGTFHGSLMIETRKYYSEIFPFIVF